jgi:hypothetical protein
MNLKDLSLQKILLVLLVLFVSMGIGWYGEKAVEKFTSVSKVVPAEPKI